MREADLSKNGSSRREPLTEEEFQKIDHLLRTCPDLSMEVIALRMNCGHSVVQQRNKTMGIRVFSRNTQPKPKKPIRHFKVKYKDLKGGFL